MKKRVFISAFVVCVALLGLFVVLPGNRASAAVLYSQTTDSQNYSGGHTHELTEGIIQLDTDIAESIWNSITLRGHCDTSDEIIDIGIGPNNSYWGSGYAGGTATTTCSYGTEIHDYTFNLNIDVATQINDYRVVMECAPEYGGNNCWVVLGINNTGFLPRVKTPKNNYGIYQYTAPAGAKDESFYYILEGVAPNSIALTFPIDTSSISDFSDWILDYNYQEFPSQAFVFVKSSTNDLATCEGHWNEMLADGSYCFKDGQALYNTAESGYLLDKGNILAAGNYNAKADLGYYTLDEYLNATFHTILSDTITFTITGTHPPDWEGWFTLPTSTTSTSPIITCDPADNFFQYSLCKLGLALFMPSQNSLTNFSNLGNMIKTKAPIGYFYLIQTAFNSLSTSTAAISLGDMGPVSTYIFTPFRIGISFILWLFFAVWLFNRIKNFNL